MAKQHQHRQRPLPSTPGATLTGPTDPAGTSGRAGASGPSDPTGAAAPGAARPAAPRGAPAGRTVPARPQRVEPEYLIQGTGCTEGHERGHELDSGRLGRLPSRKLTRMGFGLVLWCTVGLAFFVESRWLLFSAQLLVLWLAFSAVVQRRAGHRCRCWRTRAWRHAWGGLVPMAKIEKTPPAGR